MLHCSVLLELNADSTECCPDPGMQHLMAAGTYQVSFGWSTCHLLLGMPGLTASPQNTTEFLYMLFCECPFSLICTLHAPPLLMLQTPHPVIATQLDEATQARQGRLYLFSLAAAGSAGQGQSASGAPASGEAEGSAVSGERKGSSSGSGLQIQEHGNYTLKLQHTTDMPGIFDLKWCPWVSSSSSSSTGSTTSSSGGDGGAAGLLQRSRTLLGAALADGTLRIYGLQAGAAGEAAGQEGSAPSFHEVASCQACDEGMNLSLDWQQLAGAAGPSGLVATSSSSGTASVLQVGSCLPN